MAFDLDTQRACFLLAARDYLADGVDVMGRVRLLRRVADVRVDGAPFLGGRWRGALDRLIRSHR